MIVVEEPVPRVVGVVYPGGVTATLLAVEDARKEILSAVKPLAGERVPLVTALGRVLAEAITSNRSLPPFDNSAMDGYAVRAGDAAGASERTPVALTVTQVIYAGQKPSRSVGPGEAARIMTGAPIPPGADAVVMQEKTRVEGDRVFILSEPAAGESVRPHGEDVRAGDVPLQAGTPLGPSEIALLAALGRSRVLVARRPKVGIFSTGDELTDIHTPTAQMSEEGRIVDSNGWGTAAQVAQAGGDAVRLGIARDDRAEIERLIDAADSCDVVLSTAGVSVGERDFVRDALAARGVDMRFWKVAMRPGKPLAFGVRGDRLFFGLPGNPTSSMVSFELFVRPALLALQGSRSLDRPRLQARLTQPFRKAPGLTWFVRARLTFGAGLPAATPVSRQSSGLITSMVGSNALLVIPPSVESVPEGGEVEAILLVS